MRFTSHNQQQEILHIASNNNIARASATTYQFNGTDETRSFRLFDDVTYFVPLQQ
jgi:hypothetical protein